MILFQNISKKFGDNVVLEDVSLEIEGGEFVSIVGPSGAGKTTLISMLIGEERPDFGTLSVDDYDILSMDANTLQYYRRNIGVVFQDYKLLPKKTVFENIAFVMEVCGDPDEEIDKKVHSALSMVGMTHRKNHFPDMLSGGEKQKAAIARAVVHGPKLLIADEPTGNLDPQSTREIIDILLKIHHNDTTVILASHDREMVDLVNQRVVMMHNGRIISDKMPGTYDLDLLNRHISDLLAPDDSFPSRDFGPLTGFEIHIDM